MRLWLAWCVALVLCLPLLADARQESPSPVSDPQKALDAAVLVEGLIRLDVTVTDRDGAAVSNLQRTDFTVLDDGHPRKIIAFRTPTSPYPPPKQSTAVIILIDTLDLEPRLADLERSQVAKFLRRNEGHLVQPVTVYSLDNKGLALQAKPSRDGKGLAMAVESGSTIDFLFGTPSSNATNIDRDYRQFAPITGIRAFGVHCRQPVHDSRPQVAALGRSGVPGQRKRLLYRPGFLDVHSAETRRFLLAKAQWLSTCLRQTRITLDTFSVGEDEESFINVQDPHFVTPPAKGDGPTDSAGRLIQVRAKDAWKLYLDVVPSLERGGIMDVYKKTLAVKSGGRILPASDDLSGQIESCAQQADSFYTLTFDPPQAAKPNEYHFLQIGLSHPGYTAHLRTGYYNQLFYGDPPNPAVRDVSATQFGNIVMTLSMRTRAHEGPPREISALQLTERLSGRRAAELMNRFSNAAAADAVRAVIDQSVFLPPPQSEILPDPPPDQATQQNILASAADYLSHIIPKLPNFVANRSTVLLDQGFSNRDPSAAAFEAAPFHITEAWSGTVTYSSGKEVVTSGRPRSSSRASSQSIYGIFGPFLSYTIRVALDLPGSVTWSRWERGHGSRLAVFRFEVSFDKTLYYRVSGCCLPGTGESYGILPGYHGEITIDPANGAILRVQVQTVLPGFVPANRSDVMVEYGPVAMGDKTYMVPLRSIAVHRGRTMLAQKQEDWNTSFQT